MEDPLLELSDHLLYAVFNLCSVKWPYMFPATSRGSQRNFDSNFVDIVWNILKPSTSRFLFLWSHTPLFWNLTEDTFSLAAEKLKLKFNAADQCFILMVLVALLGVYFVKCGNNKKEARAWAFRFISRLAKRCDLRRQCFILPPVQDF